MAHNRAKAHRRGTETMTQTPKNAGEFMALDRAERDKVLRTMRADSVAKWQAELDLTEYQADVAVDLARVVSHAFATLTQAGKVDVGTSMHILEMFISAAPVAAVWIDEDGNPPETLGLPVDIQRPAGIISAAFSSAIAHQVDDHGLDEAEARDIVQVVSAYVSRHLRELRPAPEGVTIN